MNGELAPPVAISVVIPTIGRTGLLRHCLETVTGCRPAAQEILVVDQSQAPPVAELVAKFAGVRLVPSNGLGVARGRNDGLRTAAYELVLVTDDDCTVTSDWIGTAWSLAQRYPGAIITGQVLPVGDPRAVPSTKVDTLPRDLSRLRRGGVLFPNNMLVPRTAVLELEGFDERFGSEAAQDNEFCYRWLKAGNSLRFEPSLVVSHHDWRSPEELERLYVRYARGEGFFYAKHLRQGDLRMLLFIVRDVYRALRGLASALVKRREAWTDPRRGILRGLPGGLVAGWRTFRREP